MFVKDPSELSMKERKKLDSFQNDHGVTFYYARTVLNDIPRVVVLGQENYFKDFVCRETYFFTFNEAFRGCRNIRSI